jgi:hypothetical protein
MWTIVVSQPFSTEGKEHTGGSVGKWGTCHSHWFWWVSRKDLVLEVEKTCSRAQHYDGAAAMYVVKVIVQLCVTCRSIIIPCKDGRKERRKEGGKEGRMEGKKEGRMEGRKEG